MIVALLIAASPTGVAPGDLASKLQGPTQATIRVELAVTETGSVDGCKVIDSDAPPAVGERMCKVLTEKARFAVARDATGKPVRATASRTIRFALQD